MGLASIMSFVGCQKNEFNNVDNAIKDGSTFELVANIAQTKTTVDGYAVDWEEGDIVYMVTTDEKWGAAYTSEDDNLATIAEFTYADGKFATDATIEDGSYTFNAMYARSDQKTWHRGAGSTHNLLALQTQDCNNPTAHIKQNDALVGTFTVSTPVSEVVNVTMSHLYTMMQVDVKNNTGAAIEVTKFEMTAAGANIAGIFNVTSFETASTSLKTNASESITVNVTGGSVAADASLPVYFVMAPIKDYSGDVTFKVTDSEGKTYSQTMAVSELSFKAGKYNTTPYVISTADVVAENVTWDLTKSDYVSAAANEVKWTSDYVDMTLAKGSSTTNANNYLGGNVNPDNNSTNAHTRVYKGHIITFAPVATYRIDKIEFEATVASYTDELTNSTWSNGSASAKDKYVTVIPVDGYAPISVTIGAATRFTSVKVYYSYDENYVPPVLESISVGGEYKTEFIQGESFSFGGVVTATYNNNSTKDVTDQAEFSGYNLSEMGTQIVTVSYSGKSTSYEITVTPVPSGAKSWVLVTDASTLQSGDVIRLGCKSKNKAAGAMGTEKYFKSVDASYNNNVMTSTDAIDITLGGSADNWTLTTSEGVIGTSGNKSLNKAGTGTKTWTISINSTGAATIKSTNTSYGWIQYNPSSPRFLNYTSNQTSIEIYRYE